MTTGRIVRPPQADVNSRELKLREAIVRDLALKTAYANTTSSYTVAARDHYIFCDTTSNPITVTLPDPATCPGKIIVIKDVFGTANVNNITVATAAGLIDGSATRTLLISYKSETFVSNGSGWLIISAF